MSHIFPHFVVGNEVISDSCPCKCFSSVCGSILTAFLGDVNVLKWCSVYESSSVVQRLKFCYAHECRSIRGGP